MYRSEARRSGEVLDRGRPGLPCFRRPLFTKLGSLTRSPSPYILEERLRRENGRPRFACEARR